MNKKTALLIITILTIVLLFLLFLLYNLINFQSEKNLKVDKKESLTTKLSVGDLLLNIKQSADGYYLEFKTKDKYSCSKLDYDFSVDENQGVLSLYVKSIIKYKSCDRDEINLMYREKIPSARNWVLELKYKDKYYKYNINFGNNSFNISGDDNIKTQSHFENNSYITISSKVAKITVDYMDKSSETEVNEIFSKLNVIDKELKFDEAKLSFDDIKTLSFKSTADYSIQKYFEFDNEEIFKTIVDQYKGRDCYLNKGLKNCISIDLRTSTGYRYCTWLNVTY